VQKPALFIFKALFMNQSTQVAPLAKVAILGRCPRCGEGPLFDGYIRIAPTCSTCGLSFAGHDTGDGPAFFVIMPLSIITAVLALLLEVKVGPPIWVHITVWPLFVAAFVALALRPVKAVMVALQYRYRDVERDAGSGQE
jgi:uncharacterized protein (DUF983 family)